MLGFFLVIVLILSSAFVYYAEKGRYVLLHVLARVSSCQHKHPCQRMRMRACACVHRCLRLCTHMNLCVMRSHLHSSSAGGVTRVTSSAKSGQPIESTWERAAGTMIAAITVTPSFARAALTVSEFGDRS